MSKKSTLYYLRTKNIITIASYMMNYKSNSGATHSSGPTLVTEHKINLSIVWRMMFKACKDCHDHDKYNPHICCNISELYY
jgi:hypothetical protein